MAAFATHSSRPLSGSSPAWRTVAAVASLLALPYSDEMRASTDFFFGGDLTAFHYEEFTDSDELFNREEGPVPGVRLSLQGDDGELFTRIDLSYHSGEVDYWSPASGDSTTGTRFLTLAVEAGGWLEEERRVGAFVRVARRFWDRDIYGTENAAGLYEEYRWSEIGVGLRRQWRVGVWTHEVAGTVYAVTEGRMFVKLSGVPGRSWDDETLDLGDESGIRLRYTFTRHLADGKTLRIEPYYEYWEFGRSNKARVTSDGAPTNLVVWEPRSESQRVGVAVGFLF